jgi:xanthine/CO dehydrogenase XdhC/CoxF family maturation factor
VKHWKETAEVFARVARATADGRRAALATVVRIEGSAYRRPGAKLLVEEDGGSLGSISGGCLEGDVREIALAALRENAPFRRRYETGADENAAWGLGLGCAGSVELFVQPLGAAALAAIDRALALLEARRPIAVCTVLTGPASGGIVVVSATGKASGTTGDARLDAEIATRAREGIDSRVSRTVDWPGGTELFVEILAPPPRLLLVGADDDAIPLCALASAVGFAVSVVDHRPAFLSAERFPQAERRLLLRPEEDRMALVGPHTFAVVKTHLIAHDREWARQLLAAGAEYVGLLGPRARVREIARSIGAEDDPRLYGPVGLDLGAEGAEQVALSIVAELVAARSGAAPRHLREKEDRVHA